MQCKNLKDIRALLVRLSKNPAGMREAATHSLSLMAQFQAAELWLAKTPDNEDTEELRRQLSHLNEKGTWVIDWDDYLKGGKQ